jgi:glutathione-regulated potassium-efflux system protein KefB
MTEVTLAEIAVLLAALAIAAPLARTLGIGSVLGYIVAGTLMGPFGFSGLFSTKDASSILHIAEFGVVLLLFLIGLELRPTRLWSMRTTIAGLGVGQVALTGGLLAIAGVALGLGWRAALFAGLALALSSTAFALQVMEENDELTTRHGRAGFAVLLFQDLAAIPLIALAPLFAVGVGAAGAGMDFLAAAKALAVIAVTIGVGYLVLDSVIRLVALTKVREAMTAMALLTIVTMAVIMQSAGLSASLGAFIAGALLSESSYRHQLEADIQPFEGLLLGLFFTAIGMSLDLTLLTSQWKTVLALTLGLVIIKALVLYGLGIWNGLGTRPSRRLGLSLSQGGEFAFVLFTAGVAAGVLDKQAAAILALVVTLSMVMTPLLMILERAVFGGPQTALGAFDQMPDNDGHVIIAGFGRYGQIAARILRGKKIPFTALDISAEQVELVKKFGSKAFFGDASRPDILEAAQIGNARAFVLAIDDVEASLRTAEIVTSTWPSVPIYARARNRQHFHRLMDLGVKNIQRETFLSSLDTTRQLLRGLGFSERDAERTVAMFRSHDERRLGDDYKHYTDMEKMQIKARNDAATLEQLFADDEAEALKVTAVKTA